MFNYVAVKLENGKVIKYELTNSVSVPSGFDAIWALSDWNIYILAYNVSQNIQNGVELPLRIASAVGDRYICTSFASSNSSVSYDSSYAFDGNIGTRHYSVENQAQNHVCGILTSQETLITSVRYEGEYPSTVFKIEYSSDSTTGFDGTWNDIGNYDINTVTLDMSGMNITCTGLRFTWISPTSSQWANVRDLIIYGKQI
jgi:hypothetical protein